MPMFNVTVESRGSPKNVRRHPLVVIENHAGFFSPWSGWAS